MTYDFMLENIKNGGLPINRSIPLTSEQLEEIQTILTERKCKLKQQYTQEIHKIDDYFKNYILNETPSENIRWTKICDFFNQ